MYTCVALINILEAPISYNLRTMSGARLVEDFSVRWFIKFLINGINFEGIFGQ